MAARWNGGKAEEQLAAAQATIAEMREALTECRSSVKFDLLHYEKMARAYGNLGAESKQTHEGAEAEALAYEHDPGA
jgi:hypothetical protein